MFQRTRPPVVALLVLWSTMASWALVQAADPVARGPASKPRDFSTRSTAQSAMGAGASGSQAALVAATTISNLPVVTATLDQYQQAVIPDGGGGYIVAWTDYRNGTQDIYATRLNGAGVPLWIPDGVPVFKGAGFQYNPLLVSDGLGGAIVAWWDNRNGNLDIFAQRLDAIGVPQWNTNGVAVCTATGDQRLTAVLSDGTDGALFAWEDDRASGSDIYVQRMTDLGAAVWTPEGVAVCLAAGTQQAPAMVSDELSGAIVTWQDFRNGATSDIFARRVNASGVPQWSVDGVGLCTASETQETPDIAADGAGGAIVAWGDARTLANGLDVFAQRVNSTGVVQWAPNGVALATAAGDQKRPRIVTDRVGGAVAAWQDFRGGATGDVYAQRLNGAGASQWTAGGVTVCAAADNQLDVALVPDNGGGGVFVAWSDARTPANGLDVYAQRLDAAGAAQWTPNGLQLCDSGNAQDQPVVVADGVGGAFVAWRDYRTGIFADVYAERVDATGVLSDQCVPPALLLSTSAVTAAGPSNNYTYNQTYFFWSALGVRGPATDDWDFEVYAPLSYGDSPYPTCFGNPLAGSYQTGVADFVAGNFNDNHTPPGTYHARAFRYSGSGAGTVEWDDGPNDLVLGAAPLVLGTDATDVLTCWDVFLAANQTYTFKFRRTVGTADVKMLLFSSVGAPGFTYLAPRSDRVLETTNWSIYTTPASQVGSQYYGVVVVNDNGGSGTYELGAELGVATGVGGGSMASTGLQGMSPNPSKGNVQIRFALREASSVSFQVFDMAGRVVARIPARTWGPGAWSVAWDGRGTGREGAAPGLYFVQMMADDRVVGFGRLTLLH